LGQRPQLLLPQVPQPLAVLREHRRVEIREQREPRLRDPRRDDRPSSRSRSRVRSGSRVIIRLATSPQDSPALPAPRKILSTLYWVPVRPNGLRKSSNRRPITSFVRASPSATSSSTLPNGRRCLISSLRRCVMAGLYSL
jgi:hypothetical protein